MKKLLALFTLAAIALCPFAGFAQPSLEKDPAYLPIDNLIDLKAIPPQVNVNLPRFLLKDILSGLTNGITEELAKNGIDLADIVKDVKLIRVVVIETAPTNRPAVDKAVQRLRTELESKWTTIISVPEKNNSVGVYAMGDPAGETIAGLAVLVTDGNNVVIVNVVGHVSLGNIIKIAAQSNKLPKDLLNQLAGITGGTSSNKPANNNATDSTNKPSGPRH